MQVTLKKAADLSRAALDAANKIKPKTTVSVSVYQKTPVAETVAKARDAVTTAETQAKALLDVAFALRQRIGEANARCGIDAALTDRALLDAQERRLTALTEGVEHAYDASDAETVAARIEALKARAANPQGGLARFEESFDAVVLDAADVAAITADLAAIRRRKSDLKDQIAGLNLSNHVVLDDAHVQVLRQHGLVA